MTEVKAGQLPPSVYNLNLGYNELIKVDLSRMTKLT